MKTSVNNKEKATNNNINALLYDIQKRVIKLEENGGIIPQDLNVNSITSTTGTIDDINIKKLTLNEKELNSVFLYRN